MNKKLSLLKISMKPFTIIFWAIVVVAMAFFGLLLKYKKISLKKK